jgi:hypothetical protein
MALREMLNPKLNPYFREGGMFQGFLVQDPGGRCLGRFALSYSPSYVKHWQHSAAFLGFFELVNHPGLASSIFTFAQDYSRKTFGTRHLIGPITLSTNYECGLLIHPFDTPPSFQMAFNPPYYVELFENSGHWKPIQDLLAFDFPATTVMDPKVIRVTELLKKKFNVSLRSANFKNFDQDSQIMYDIYHDAWKDNWGFTPCSKDEWDFLCKDLKKIAIEDFILIGSMEGEPFGFSVVIPNLNVVLKTIPNGKLFPTGVFKLLTGIRKIRQGRLITMGVKKKFQHLGLGSLFYVETHQIGKRLRYEGAELSWVLESNLPMIRSLNAVGATVSRRYRIYQHV